MSYSNSFPQQRPTLNLDFANSGKLDSRISYSRSSTGTYMSSERHKSSENLVTQSDGSDWIFSSADYTKTASQNGPDGSTNATKYTEKANGSTEYQIRSNNFTPIANKEITYSVWLKQTSGSRNYQQVRVGNIGANQAFVTFNLTNGTVDQTGGTLGVSASVNDGPTGWYQCVMKFTPTTTTALSFYIYAAAASGGEIPNVTGDTGNSFTMFGAQASTTGETVVNETSGQIHREYSPLLKTASANAPRFEFDASGNAKGLLVESQVTNLQAYSSDFTSWSGQNRVTTTSNVAIAPNGLLEADIVIANTSSTQSHNLSNASTLASGTTYTASVYAKDAGQRYIQLSGSTSAFGSSQYATFDLQTGSVDANGVTASAESVGNGWWRIQATMTATGSGSGGATIGLANSATASRLPLFVGNEYDGIILFGYQLEAAASASSLISTSGAAATKSADSCSVALNGILASGQDVTLYAEGDWGDYTVKPYNRFLAALSQNNDTNWIALYNAASSGASYIKYLDAIEAVQTGVAANGNQKAAVSVAMNSIKHAAAGVASAEDTNATVPPYTQLSIGNNRDAGSLSLNGHCTRVALYGQALSSSELVALTSS